MEGFLGIRETYIDLILDLFMESLPDDNSECLYQ